MGYILQRKVFHAHIHIAANMLCVVCLYTLPLLGIWAPQHSHCIQWLHTFSLSLPVTLPLTMKTHTKDDEDSK